MPTTGTAFNSVTKAVTGQNYKTKNASCILGITSASNTGNVSEVLTIQNSSYNQGKNNGRNALNDTRHVLALSGGVFQYQSPNTKWIMLGNNVTTTLSSVSNLTMRSGAADFFRKPIAFKTRSRISYLDVLQWTADELEGPTYAFTVNATHLDFGNDVGAALTRTSRSSLFYMVTGKLATETVYPTLNLW